jgi:hypothetical protein
MPTITQAQLDSLLSFNTEVYFGGQLVGLFEPGEMKIKVPSNLEFKGTSQTGENGFVKAVFTGSAPEVDLSAMREYNKKKFLDIYNNIFKAGVTGSIVSAPNVGALISDALPRIVPSKALVIYPQTTIGATSYISDISNPFTILLPQAVASSDFELTFNSGDLVTTQVGFQGLYDASLGGYMVIDDGITTAGVYTP